MVTPGNVHDSVAFDEVYDHLTEAFPEAETIVADSAYKTPHICKKVFDDGRVLSTAYKHPQTTKGGHEWWKYVYDEHYDRIICPEYQVLAYRTTNREGYREYRSDPKICANCPTRHLCTHSKDCVKTVQRHIWKDYEELADDVRYTPKYQKLLFSFLILNIYTRNPAAASCAAGFLDRLTASLSRLERAAVCCYDPISSPANRSDFTCASGRPFHRSVCRRGPAHHRWVGR